MFGCGVGCLATVTGESYATARNTFSQLGFGALRKGREPFSSNFKELIAALAEHEINGKQERWRCWESVAGSGIVKVRCTPRNWHWIVVETHPEYGFVVHDPGSRLPSFGCPPSGVMCRPIEQLEPYGNWIRVE